MDVFYKFKLSW